MHRLFLRTVHLLRSLLPAIMHEVIVPIFCWLMSIAWSPRILLIRFSESSWRIRDFPDTWTIPPTSIWQSAIKRCIFLPLTSKTIGLIPKLRIIADLCWTISERTLCVDSRISWQFKRGYCSKRMWQTRWQSLTSVKWSGAWRWTPFGLATLTVRSLSSTLSRRTGVLNIPCYPRGSQFFLATTKSKFNPSSLVKNESYLRILRWCPAKSITTMRRLCSSTRCFQPNPEGTQAISFMVTPQRDFIQKTRLWLSASFTTSSIATILCWTAQDLAWACMMLWFVIWLTRKAAKFILRCPVVIIRRWRTDAR